MTNISKGELSKLSKYISFKTVSASSKSKEIKQALRWLEKLMKDFGFDSVQILRTKKSHPAIVGQILTNKSNPSICIYGHIDVQPAGKANMWKSNPFKLDHRGNYLFGRGISDNKGQNLAVLFALKNLINNRQNLKYNVKVFLESSEEIASQGLLDIFNQHKKVIDSDYFIAIDGDTCGKMQPTLYNSSKGILYYKIIVKGANKELHSGYFGGIVNNPAIELSRLLASLVSSSGEIGFLSKKKYRDTHTTLDVHSMQVGDPRFIKTSIPTSCTATFSIRTIPGQKTKVVDEALRRHAKKTLERTSLSVNINLLVSAEPCTQNVNSKIIRMVSSALDASFTKNTKVKTLSGTLPAFSIAKKVFNKPFVIASFGAPNSNSHSSNEKLYIPHYLAIKDFVANLLTKG
jgi:acetylornithine deacetylase/succinyl-diaminopimelate desuccinylase-like protein